MQYLDVITPVNSSRGVRRNLLREACENGFLQISRDGEDLALEINILSAEFGDQRVTVTRIMAETHV